MIRKLVFALALAFVALSIAAWPPSTFAAAGHTEVTWYGQSAFKVVTPTGHVLLFDPWFANPMNKEGKATGDALKTVDLILVSHGHFDHVGQAADISRRTGAKLVASLDLGEAMARYGGFPRENMSYQTLGNAGGILTFFDGEVRILLVPAVHSSHISGKDLGQRSTTPGTLMYFRTWRASISSAASM
jgi:L-ascorbate metabolism protein UlaG (beta-lactamase superfamily)